MDAESIVDALLEVGTSRRSFLKTVGAGLAAAAFAPASAVGNLAQSAAKVATPARRSGGFFFYGLDAAGRGVISNDGVNYRYADNEEPARLAEPAKRQKQKAPQAPQQKATAQQQVHGRSERDLPMQRMPESLDDDDLKSFARETPRWYTARGSRTDAFIHSYLRVTRETDNAIHGDLYFFWVDGPKRGDFERMGETYIKKDYPEDWVPATGREARRVAQMFQRHSQNESDMGDDDLKSFAREMPEWYVYNGYNLDSYFCATGGTENEIHGQQFHLHKTGPKRGQFTRVGPSTLDKQNLGLWQSVSQSHARMLNLPALLEASAPEWVQQRMSARVAAGWNPRWPFVPVDVYNPGFREAIQSDPELSDAEKQQILSFAPGGKNERSLFGESIAVDLDGTLARDNGWKGPEHIGKPIKPMLDLVQKLLDDGEEVVIFTARCHDGKSSTKDYVKQWLKDNGLPDLEVTNEKRPDMEKFYDDKAVEVATNKGVAE